MTTEAAIIVIAAAVVLITLLTYLAGRQQHRDHAAAPGETPRAAEHGDRSVLSERDAVLGDGERDGSGRFARAGELHHTR